jgi:asparagine synthase (glutamine-hydrolysing)
MCGIAGAIGTSPQAEENVGRMLARQAHRGPDAEGRWRSPGLVLGHRRLSIIDLSDDGRQPMANEDGQIQITFNGEIYNYRELRAELESRHQWRSHADTEVIIHGYEQWGIEGLVKRLRGMFAFVLVDLRQHKQYLVRDRLGIKPLYYGFAGETLYFASEVKALREVLPAGGLDVAGVVGFLGLGSVPSPRTYAGNIHSVPAGYYLEVRAGRVERTTCYWDLNTAKPESDWDLGELFRDTVERHLLADVPTGVFLSGGVDSSGLVAVARRFVNGPLKTVTVRFAEPEFDESSQAREFAAALGSEHHEVEVGEKEFLGELDRVLAVMDQPTADGINTYFVSQAARQIGLKVVLSGLGGDEVFLGYSHHKRLFGGAAGYFWKAPKLLRDALAAGAVQYGRSSGQERWERFSGLARLPLNAAAYLVARGFFPPRQIGELLGVSEKEVLSGLEEALTQGGDGAASVEAIQYLETQRYLHDQLLRDSDVFSMAHSIELRVPYLDHVLVEHVRGIPSATKFSPEMNKPLLVKAIDDPVVTAAARRKKRGFTFPFALWMRRHAGALEERALAGQGLERAAVRRCWGEFRAGRMHWSRAWATVAVNELGKATV